MLLFFASLFTYPYQCSCHHGGLASKKATWPRLKSAAWPCPRSRKSRQFPDLNVLCEREKTRIIFSSSKEIGVVAENDAINDVRHAKSNRAAVSQLRGPSLTGSPLFFTSSRDREIYNCLWLLRCLPKLMSSRFTALCVASAKTLSLRLEEEVVVLAQAAVPPKLKMPNILGLLFVVWSWPRALLIEICESFGFVFPPWAKAEQDISSKRTSCRVHMVLVGFFFFTSSPLIGTASIKKEHKLS